MDGRMDRRTDGYRSKAKTALTHIASRSKKRSSNQCSTLMVTFYRATLCVSAVLAVGRCPSVRLSVTLVYCIQTAKDIDKLFSYPGSPTILVSCSHPLLPNSKEDSLSKGVKYIEVGNIYFRLKSVFISETVRDRLMVVGER